MIKIKSLTKKYQQNIIFKDFNLDLPDNGLFIIIGESGSGKSTLLNIIYNLITDYQGLVKVVNHDIKLLNDRENSYYKNKIVSLMFQSNDLINILTPRENIQLISNNNYEIEKLASQFEVTKLLDKETKYLSLGEKARINLIRSLINNQDIILLDEPLASLDNKMALKIIEYLKELSKEKLIIFNSHIIDELRTYLDGEIIFQNNQIISIINKKTKEKKLEILELSYHRNIFAIAVKFLKSNFKILSVLGLFNSIGLIIMLLGIITSTTIKSSINDILPNIFSKNQLNVSNYYNQISDFEIEEIKNSKVVTDIFKVNNLNEEVIYLVSDQSKVIPFPSEIIFDNKIPENELVITTTEKNLKNFNYLIINNIKYYFGAKCQVITGDFNRIYSSNLSFFSQELNNYIPESEFSINVIAKYNNQQVASLKEYFLDSDYSIKKSLNPHYFYLEKKLFVNDLSSKIEINDLFYTSNSDIYLDTTYDAPIKFKVSESNKLTSSNDLIISSGLASKIKTKNLELTFSCYQSIFSSKINLDTKKLTFNVVEVIESDEIIVYQKANWNLKVLEEYFDINAFELRSKEVIIFSDSSNIKREIKNLQLNNQRIEVRSYYLEATNYFNEFTGFLILSTSTIAFLISILASLILIISIKYLYLIREKDFNLLKKLGFTFKDLFIIKAIHNLLIGLVTFIFSLIFLFVLSQMKNQNTKLNAFSNEDSFILDLLGNIEITPLIILLAFLCAFLIPFLILIISVSKELFLGRKYRNG